MHMDVKSTFGYKQVSTHKNIFIYVCNMHTVDHRHKTYVIHDFLTGLLVFFFATYFES